MKKVLLSLLVGTMAMSFMGCGGTQQKDVATSSDGEKQLTVAAVVFQEDQFMKLLQMGYKDAAEKYGAKCLTANTNNDQGKETESINTYVAQGVNGIAIAPINEQTSLQTLKSASDKGMQVAVSNTPLEGNEFVVGGFTSTNYDLGKQTGEAAKKFIEENLDGKANVAVVQFKSQIPQQSADRVNGFLDQIKGLPGVKIVADQDAWLQDQSIQVVGDILTANESNGGVDIIFGANDGGTIGAAMAVKNANKSGKTFVFGIDAAQQQIDMLRSEDNILQAVTGQDPYQIGYKTMEVLIKSLKGEETGVEKGKATSVPGITLSRDNKAGLDSFEKDLKEKTK